MSYLVFAHRAGESSTGTSVTTEVITKVLKVLKEPLWVEGPLVSEDIPRVPEVLNEPP